MKIRNIKTLRIWRYLLEWATFVGVICLMVFFALTASILPEPASLPQDGIVAAVGFQNSLLILFLIGGGLNGLLFLLSRFPRLYHYPVPITAENIESQYHLAKIALCIGQLIVTVTFCVLMARVYTMSITFLSTEFRGIIATALVVSGITCVVYFLASRHYK
ncbi:MAG: hypothetical protein VB082_06025 [Christensenella sp.]|nr:hypothetical protein [Christensenella sp.]